MLVIIKSAPDMPDGRQGMKLAQQMAADIILLQNGVYFAVGNHLQDLSGRAYILEQDLKLRGLGATFTDKGIHKINYDAMVDLIAESKKVVGMF